MIVIWYLSYNPYLNAIRVETCDRSTEVFAKRKGEGDPEITGMGFGIGWIHNVYNNTRYPVKIKSVDARHNGCMSSEGKSFDLHDGEYHTLAPNSHYECSWFGIPWYCEGRHFKAYESSTSSGAVSFYTSEIDGENWIVFEDDKGRTIQRQKAPKASDYYCTMRFEYDGAFIDILNNNTHSEQSWERRVPSLKWKLPLFAGLLDYTPGCRVLTRLGQQQF